MVSNRVTGLTHYLFPLWCLSSVRPSGGDRRPPLRSPHDIPDVATRPPNVEPPGRRGGDSPSLFTREISPQIEIKKPKI
jgi:hypothetical protein